MTEKMFDGWKPTVLCPGVDQELSTGEKVLAGATETEAAFFFGGLCALTLVHLEKGSVPLDEAPDTIEWTRQIVSRFMPNRMGLQEKLAEISEYYPALYATYLMKKTLGAKNVKVLNASDPKVEALLKGLEKNDA